MGFCLTLALCGAALPAHAQDVFAGTLVPVVLRLVGSLGASVYVAHVLDEERRTRARAEQVLAEYEASLAEARAQAQAMIAEAQAANAIVTLKGSVSKCSSIMSNMVHWRSSGVHSSGWCFL